LIAALVIIIFPTLVGPALHGVDVGGTLESILVWGIEEAILIVGVPMLIGLVWNQWAGGAAGFLLGSIYSISTYQLYGLSGTQHIFLLGFVVSAMLIGYVAGAMNKGSFSFLRMIISGLTAAIVGGLFLFFTYKIPFDIINAIPQPVDMAADVPYVLFLTMLPRIIFGIIIPIFAKVFSWFGVSPRRMS
jgi:hypothetical protein